jgi:hypoxanthine-DNA glycosylase
MSALFDMEKEWFYQRRCKHLIANKVAVWDALKACQRQGSLDSNIEPSSMIANDFNTFFQQHPKIERVFFNGGKAEQVFKQYVMPNLDELFRQLSQIRLPSTSPAHAAITFEQKLRHWRENIIID